MRFKVGDRFVYVGPVYGKKNPNESITGTIKEIHSDGEMWGLLDSDNEQVLLVTGGYRYYGRDEDNYIISEEIYYSPLYQALR